MGGKYLCRRIDLDLFLSIFAEFTSDYKKAEFHIEEELNMIVNESIIFGINYSINNDYINKLISNDEIGLLLDCV